MEKNKRNILVLGASGFVGNHLVSHLLRAGHQVRLASRDLARLARPQWQQCQHVQADVLDVEALQLALEQIDVVYFLVHAMTEGANYHLREQQGAFNLAQAAAAAGVKRIIYLGAVCPPGAQSAHLTSRIDTGNILRQGSVAVVELRSPVVIGPGSAAFEVMRDLVANLPVMITPRWVRSKMAPIALDDLLFYLLSVLDADDCEQKIYDIAGPQILTYEQQMHRLASILNRRIHIIPVPLLSPDLSSHWLRFITSVPEGIAKALIGGLKHDLVSDASAIQARFPRQLLNFDAAVKQTLAQEQTQLVAQDPSMAALLKRRWQSSYSFYPKQEQATVYIDASPQRVWREICQIGGRHRYFAMDPLWRIREFIDALIGGDGMRYYRRDPHHLQIGDRIDSWRVAECLEAQQLTLHFGMKAPGMGGLTFALEPEGHGCTLLVKCWWYPSGAPGLLYWWAMLPAHAVIFQRMGDNIRRLSSQPTFNPSIVK
ncbi:DUF2867 domain-containing protein [Ferrimonas lipolytica]|uniref:SDR family oxidoreductase n=1 Tax=Ferrimonas lipolytica TaxID=2724191 RepID=A0A6H1UJJ4_9GAMM|nr:DUF2867 domain-containing protein [Ferrimonas lipolytica]QIZ77972.1 SDR family oxidoreductase [Ferrimonas lipolytica]